ncbi:putative RNA methylase family protein [Lineolata rhizophorae]|uniref:Trimethylguanosine synthase n=1 Tax=Lineolata rhizophorae TaxID=578093 RepID=A0A6A6P6H0_9PEZI|nr:putative RNA methylase family protein [Lineolata rhizophorae]
MTSGSRHVAIILPLPTMSEVQLHYEKKKDVPESIRKYWDQRKDLFSLYHHGIHLTHDAWFGVTPEAVANKIATDVALAVPENKNIIIDAFGGAGGNTIAFARSGRWERIFAIEKDPEVIKCAKRNAEIYGVANKIWWVEGDVFDMLSTRFKSLGGNAVVFASPPWGGPAYRGSKVFDLSRMQPYNLATLLPSLWGFSGHVVLYLPRTSDLNQLAEYVPKGDKIQVRHYCLHGASKALCVYYGNWKAFRS